MAAISKPFLRAPAFISSLVSALVLFSTAAVSPSPAPDGNVNDFVAYWAAARQVLAGGDPYAARPVFAIEQQLGLNGSTPLIMRNPPWAVPVIAPFGLLSFAAAQQLWFGLGLIAVLLSAHWLWGLYHGEGQPPWTAWLATGLFLPVAVVLALGQISPLVLLGIVGFLHFQKQKKLGWAGAFLFLCALKPHLTFLLWVALLLWSIRSRTIRTLIAFAGVTITASMAAIAFDPAIFSQYLNLLTNGGVLAELTPTISGLLRLSLGRYYPIQTLPAALALIWFFFHWRRTKEHWEWPQEMPALLLISLLTVSYAWFFDQVVLLPAVFEATAWTTANRRLASVALVSLYLGTNAAVLALILGHRTTFWYVWIVPAWCLLYALARGLSNPIVGGKTP